MTTVFGNPGSTELPMLGDVLKMLSQAIEPGIKWAQTVQTYVSLDFANSALLAYFVTTVGILLGLVFASFIISWVLTGLASLVIPTKARVRA